MTTGPLAGCRVVELAGIGPGPFAAMTLADLGAEVVRVDRPGRGEFFPGVEDKDLLNRGKKSVALDLKRPRAVAAALTLVTAADVLIEGFRPGVAERLGLGPEVCLERNPRLVYGRMTGWGRTGPLARTAGHDINYLSVTGALHAMGDADGPPAVPLNLVGDFGGGGAYLVIGVLAALHEAARSGRGQVVDTAIVDGVAHLLTGTHALMSSGQWQDARGTNLLDGSTPFYTVYATMDGRHMAVGALENRFYRVMLELLEVDEDPALQHDRSRWPALRERLAHAFLSRTQADWTDVFAGSDACVSPVVSLRDAAAHPQLQARGTLVERNETVQAAPAPRFSRTPPSPASPPPPPGRDTAEVLATWGVADAEELISSGAAVQT
ncbi:CaiB/BaiF CoA transferase family protein [Streptomyces sp. NPDC004609]|uniref:CaiB/BaiF CoA transferase family protein n=1 Tax=Streptomyces sp. NPDC004609 TaxID=3364704 RepID=UPI0036A3565F